MKTIILALLMMFGVPAMAQNKKDSVYTVVDQMPEFQGNMHQYLSQNIRIPAISEDDNLPGKVIVSFVIDKKGITRDIKITRSSGLPKYDEHLIKVVKNMPKWKPGILNGKKVNVQYTLPVIVCFLGR